MKKNTRQDPRRMFISRAKNRPYNPNCPADIVSASFFLDLKLQKKVMKLRIRNRGDRPLTGLTLLARYLSKDGAVIGTEEGHILLRFQGMYCAPHQTSLGSKLVILPYQDIAGIEAYITEVIYEDGTADTFSLSAYTMSPPQQMLEDHVSAADIRILRASFGEDAVFVPRLSDTRWLCACGAVAEGERCSACALQSKQADILSDPTKTAAWLNRRKVRNIVLKTLPYVAAAVLFIGGCTVLRHYAVRLIEEELPARRLAITRQYLEEHRYTEALGYSTTKNHNQLYEEILNAAVAHYCETGEYALAAQFEQCRDVPSYERIYESAARAFIARTRDDCADIALNVTDDTLYNGVLRRLSDDTIAAGDRAKGCKYALAMRGAEGIAYADSVLYDTIEVLLEDSLYEEAVSYIGHLSDTSGVSALCRGIESELIALGKYEEAFTVASITGDASVFEISYPTVGRSTLRHYYDKFYPYMSLEERREYLACDISAGGSVIRITEDGIAADSAQGNLCENAISVAAGDAHVVILQKDGTVRAFGDNTHGQLECDGMGGVIAVAAGAYHSLLLMEDGTAYAFGDNRHGQCNIAPWQDVIAIAAGDSHSVGIRANGTVIACGSNISGQCALDAYENVVGIAAGEYSTVLIFRNGRIAVAGNMAIETFDTQEWTDIVHVAAGNSHLIALTSGGRILFAGNPPYAGTEEATTWSRIRTIAAGPQSVYATDASGKIWYCGSDVPADSSTGWETFTE